MPHADQIPASRRVGLAIRRAAQLGWLTDANVAPLTTTAGLKALVSAGSGHADQLALRERVNELIDIGIADGSLTNATVAAANTVTGLMALTQAGTGDTWGDLED